jgi:predicted metalloprotease with PDZ domain
MKRAFRRSLFLAAALLAAPGRSVAQEAVPVPDVLYEVDVTRPDSGRVSVSMTIRTPDPLGEARVSIPAWAPGAYRIVKYARAVALVRAQDALGRRLAVTPVDDQTWSFRAEAPGPVTVSYELAVEPSRLSRDHCFLAGPDTYFYIVGRKDVSCGVRFRLPPGWKVGTGLSRAGDLYHAPDYDTFIDCPTELGTFELLEFREDGARYELVIHAKGPVPGGRLVDMCRKIVREHNRMFGGPPFDRYVFIYHFLDGVGGRGLEHLNSTDISMPYAAVVADPLVNASVTSHEYFHLWNVKRLRPAELGPFDYTGPVRSRHLWFCEGVTSYFGDRALARCGLWTEPVYFAHLAGEVEALQNNPDRKVTSVETASERVWDRKDWPRVDYYNKGELLGLLIDLRIRTRSGGRKSFDDVLRHLYETWCVRPAREGKGPIGVGYPEDGILRALEEVSGEEWDDFYARYVRGVEELPYREILEPAGLVLDSEVTRSPDLGVELRGTSVLSVPTDGPAARAGLRTGDRLAAINGTVVSRATLREALAALRPGDEADVSVLRDGRRMDLRLPVVLRERTSFRLRRAPSPTELQKTLVDAWLGKPADY